MPVGITAAVTGTSAPQAVQIVVTGMTVGVTYEVTGSGGNTTWPVRGGKGTAASTQLVLADLSTPILTPITYTVDHGAETATTAALSVTYTRRYVLQALDGVASAEIDLIRNDAPESVLVRQATFQIPGRTDPAVRYDVAGGLTGEFVVDTDGAWTRTLRSMLVAGAPLLFRSDGAILDMAAVMIVSVSTAQSSLIGMTRRRWSLTYTQIGYPEPNTVFAPSTWDNFDTVYAGLTWANFDTEWTGQTWNDFDAEDWATRAAP